MWIFDSEAEHEVEQMQYSAHELSDDSYSDADNSSFALKKWQLENQTSRKKISRQKVEIFQRFCDRSDYCNGHFNNGIDQGADVIK